MSKSIWPTGDFGALAGFGCLFFAVVAPLAASGAYEAHQKSLAIQKAIEAEKDSPGAIERAVKAWEEMK